MRGLPSTIALVVIAAALIGYVYYFMDASPTEEARDTVFAVEAAAIEEMTVTSSGETTVLRKVDDRWRLV